MQKTRTTASVRDVGLTEIALAHLMPGKPDEFVCGGKEPFCYSRVQRMNRRIEEQLGFDGKITPRRFRTTVLTDIYDYTKDIKATQAAAGHTTSAMTLEHYVKGRSQLTTATTTVIDHAYSA